jgi:hypothetical protein
MELQVLGSGCKLQLLQNVLYYFVFSIPRVLSFMYFII